jgi:hypothetical protein
MFITAIILVAAGLPTLFLILDFINVIFTGERLHDKVITRILEITGMVIFPAIYLWGLDGVTNDCCSDSATFSPEHRLSILVLIAICVINYFYASFKSNIASPIVEVFSNALLLLGLILNIFIAIQIGDLYWIFGNVPVGLLFISQLIINHQRFLETNMPVSAEPLSYWEKRAWAILTSKPLAKFPLLFVLSLPILRIIAALLTIFGQKPDSIIRAFTETYHHGFSQLDYMCDNVACGGHFLCSVAANGHKAVVSPIRYGERNGQKIICNRQLLVANAFEELIQQKFPKTHRVIRRQYNRVGNVIHRHYHIFNNKFVSDFIFILMKPLEMFFLLTLYTFHKKPENLIAKQYLNQQDREALNNFRS